MRTTDPLFAQSTGSHTKSTPLMQTFHYQLCDLIDLSFLKEKKKTVDSLSKHPVLKNAG